MYSTLHIITFLNFRKYFNDEIKRFFRIFLILKIVFPLEYDRHLIIGEN